MPIGLCPFDPIFEAIEFNLLVEGGGGGTVRGG